MELVETRVMYRTRVSVFNVLMGLLNNNMCAACCYDSSATAITDVSTYEVDFRKGLVVTEICCFIIKLADGSSAHPALNH